MAYPFDKSPLTDIPVIVASGHQKDSVPPPVATTTADDENVASGLGGGGSGDPPQGGDKDIEKDVGAGGDDGDEPSDGSSDEGTDPDEGEETETESESEDAVVHPELEGNPYATFPAITLFDNYNGKKEQLEKLKADLKLVEQVICVAHPNSQTAKALLKNKAKAEKQKVATEEKADKTKEVVEFFVKTPDGNTHSFVMSLKVGCGYLKGEVSKRLALKKRDFFLSLPNGDEMGTTGKALFNAGVRKDCVLNLHIRGEGGVKATIRKSNQKTTKKSEDYKQCAVDTSKDVAEIVKLTKVADTLKTIQGMEAVLTKFMAMTETDPSSALKHLTNQMTEEALDEMLKEMNTMGGTTEYKLKAIAKKVFGAPSGTSQHQ
eukprot:s89_g36.t1